MIERGFPATGHSAATSRASGSASVRRMRSETGGNAYEVTLRSGGAGGSCSPPLSQRRTQVTTTALPFRVRLASEGEPGVACDEPSSGGSPSPSPSQNPHHYSTARRSSPGAGGRPRARGVRHRAPRGVSVERYGSCYP